jgi:steroid delta-isomerase-like uncharacterized protein
MDNAAIVRRWFEEVWNQGREAAIDELMAPDAPIHGIAGPDQVHRGPAAFKPFWAQLRAALPDIRFTMDDVISQGDRVAARWTARMTHTGDQLGVVATHKQLCITGMVFARIKDGKLVEGWNSWDQLTFTRELGLPIAGPG